MRICKNCNTVFENDYPRCAMCGEETVEYAPQPEPTPEIPVEAAEPEFVAPAPEAPVMPSYAAPVQSAPVAPATPVYAQPIQSAPAATSAAPKVMSFISLGLGIFGLVFGTIAHFMAFGLFDASYYYAEELFVQLLVLGILALGGAIAGKQLASKAFNGGCVTGASKTGQTLSTVALAVCIAAMSLGTLAYMVAIM